MADLAFYRDKANVVTRMFADKGRQLEWFRASSEPGSYDPIDDELTELPPLQQDVVCIVLPASKGTIEAFDNRLVSGTLIEQNLRFLKIAAVGPNMLPLEFEPFAGDWTFFEGSRWRALGSTPINPAGVPLLYNVAVERG